METNINFDEQFSCLDEVELIQVDSKTHILKYQTRHFNIGEILYRILVLFKLRRPLQTICEIIHQEYKVDLGTIDLHEIISDCLKRIDSPKEKDTNAYVYGRIRLIKKERIQKIASLFTFLFQRRVFVPLFVIQFLISIYFNLFLYGQGIIGNNFSLKERPFYLIVYYFTIIIIGLFHEFGHASAAKSRGIDSKEIGFGFYLIFPVLFTDLTNIWELPKRSRILINLGGIYIQLYINILLICIFLIMPKTLEMLVLIKSLFVINSVMILISLNPFFRNDGYWIFSDLFGINNLSEKAAKYPVELFNKIAEKGISVPTFYKVMKELPLILYSFLTYILFSLLIFALCLLTYKNYYLLKDFFNTPFLNNQLDYFLQAGRALFSVGINVVFLTITVKRIWKMIIRSFLYV